MHENAAWDRPMVLFRWSLAVVLLAGFAAWMRMTVHWTILWDTQVMHYVNFMMDHGREPYRDITDMNMPGAYLTDRWAIAIFGRGDLAWRVYEYALMGGMTAAMMVIARPFDWFAGLFAGVVFTLMHGVEGPLNAAQRDLVMTVLMVVAYAFLFEALRERRAWLLAGFGLLMGIASAIKPTAGPFALAMLAWAMVVARRRGQRWVAAGAWGLGGLAAAVGIVVGFLMMHHALGPFLFVVRKVLPQYAGFDHGTVGYMLRRTLPTPVALLLAPAAWLAWRHRAEMSWELPALGAGAAAGFLSYYAQRKGYVYHRYILVAFVLLWIAIELARALRRRGAERWVGVVCLAAATLAVEARDLRELHQLETEDKFEQYARYLEADLSQFGVARLQGQVECLDMVYGCLNALYHLRIVQNTGSTGDMMYFLGDGRPVVQYYRAMFKEELEWRPPAVFVVSNEWYPYANSFDKVKTWPWFAAWLEENYVLVRSRAFRGHGYLPVDPATRPGADADYRIYVRRGSGLEGAQLP